MPREEADEVSTTFSQVNRSVRPSSHRVPTSSRIWPSASPVPVYRTGHATGTRAREAQTQRAVANRAAHRILMRFPDEQEDRLPEIFGYGHPC